MLETIYTDFTTKLLPKIQEGLVITKDYFIDLFGRYIKYLIVVDTISLILLLGLFFVGVYFCRKALNSKDTGDYTRGWADWRVAMFAVSILAMAFGIGFAINAGILLAKDLYIPEIRVFQQLQPIINK